MSPSWSCSAQRICCTPRMSGRGRRGHRLSRPSRWATAAASPRPVTPSLARILETWMLAVLGVMNSAWPICRLVRPRRPGPAPPSLAESGQGRPPEKAAPRATRPSRLVLRGGGGPAGLPGSDCADHRRDDLRGLPPLPGGGLASVQAALEQVGGGWDLLVRLCTGVPTSGRQARDIHASSGHPGRHLRTCAG
jgi:hypothetical protein